MFKKTIIFIVMTVLKKTLKLRIRRCAQYVTPVLDLILCMGTWMIQVTNTFPFSSHAHVGKFL